MNKFNLTLKRKKNIAILTLISFALVSLLIATSFYFTSSKQVAQASPSSSSLQEQIENLQPTLNATSNQYTKALMKEEECQYAVNEAQGRIDYCNEKIPSLQEDIGIMMKKQYRDGGFGFLDVIFNSVSFNDFMSNLNDFETVNKKNTDTIVTCKQLKEQLNSDMQLLEDKLEEAKEQSKLAADAKAEADATLAQLQTAYNNASAEEQQTFSSGNGSGSPTPQPVSGGDWAGIANIALSMCDGTHMYEWGGIGPQNFDCSGFVSYCINGGSVGRRGTTDTFLGWSPCEPTPGCIVVNAAHCGIYIGANQMVHAPSFGQCVQVGTVQDGMVYRCPNG